MAFAIKAYAHPTLTIKDYDNGLLALAGKIDEFILKGTETSEK